MGRLHRAIDGKGVRRRGWVNVDSLGCAIYFSKALLNPYTMIVEALDGIQGYLSNRPDKVATFCKNKIHYISTNTPCITLNKNVSSSPWVSLYDDTLLMSIGSLGTLKQGKRYPWLGGC